MSKDHTKKKKNYSPTSLINKVENSQSINKRIKQCINGNMCNIFKSTWLGELNIKGDLASCIRQSWWNILCGSENKEHKMIFKKNTRNTMR